ncbi:MAG: GNAT family N-acetyltransferase [Leptolyngbyaceae cyanobacterium bins.349]|nr:GNAT family N-acetyltransferase [Leptolyngbyaceae cyanobacterium bins.349]
MQLHRFDHPLEFCDRAEPYLTQNEVAHNLLLRLCKSFREANSRLQPSYLAIVEDGTQPIAVAIRTPPFPMVLSMVEDVAAIVLLADDIQTADPMLPGVNAPQAESDLFAEVWEQLTKRSYHLHMALRVHQLTQVQPVTSPSGVLRLAAAGDRDLLAAWYIAFQQEALTEVVPWDKAQDWAMRQIEYQSIYFWQVGDRPVSAACGYPASSRVAVINFVYTPPEFRKRGYASANVATLSQHLLDRGYPVCALFTDQANPTSNKIYQAIGYQPVCDWHHYRFAIAA